MVSKAFPDQWASGSFQMQGPGKRAAAPAQGEESTPLAGGAGGGGGGESWKGNSLRKEHGTWTQTAWFSSLALTLARTGLFPEPQCFSLCSGSYHPPHIFEFVLTLTGGDMVETLNG